MEDENCQENPHRREYIIAFSFFKGVQVDIYSGAFIPDIYMKPYPCLCAIHEPTLRDTMKSTKSKKMNASHYMS